MNTIIARVSAAHSPASLHRAMPSISPARQTLAPRIPPVWLLIVAQLDRSQFEFTPTELAGLLGIKPHTLRQYAGQLWPGRGSRRHYRLEWEQACVLVNYASYRSSTLNAKTLFLQLRDSGLDCTDFADGAEGLRAARAVHQFRETRAAQRLNAAR